MTPLARLILERVRERSDVFGRYASTRDLCKVGGEARIARHVVNDLWGARLIERAGPCRRGAHYRFTITDAGRDALEGF